MTFVIFACKVNVSEMTKSAYMIASLVAIISHDLQNCITYGFTVIAHFASLTYTYPLKLPA